MKISLHPFSATLMTAYSLTVLVYKSGRCCKKYSENLKLLLLKSGTNDLRTTKTVGKNSSTIRAITAKLGNSITVFVLFCILFDR